MSVKDIALEMGYSDTAAFDKAFRKVFEESPMDYRKWMGIL
jgi:AraC-like DNA-binding protein